jgi:hypothetical protein
MQNIGRLAQLSTVPCSKTPVNTGDFHPTDTPCSTNAAVTAVDKDLQSLINSWPSLTDAARQSILAIIEKQ